MSYAKIDCRALRSTDALADGMLPAVIEKTGKTITVEAFGGMRCAEPFPRKEFPTQSSREPEMNSDPYVSSHTRRP